MCSWVTSTLRRIESDLAAYEDGRLIPPDIIETFATSPELVYRELLVKDSLNGLTAQEAEACGLIRDCMVAFRNMFELLYIRENHPSGLAHQTQGSMGRPRFVINREQLSMLLEHRFSVPQIADMFGVSISTVRRRMTTYGLSVGATYTCLNDDEVDTLVGEIQHLFPMCGNRQMQGQLLARGVRVQQHRIRESQRRVDPQGSMLRRLNAIRRRVYKVAAPRSLWHIDGNHKLIRYIKFDMMIIIYTAAIAYSAQ